MKESDAVFLRKAIVLAYENVGKGGRPFGAVVVKNGRSIATGVNEVVQSNDPTAHAELTALRKASKQLQTPDLAGCTVYASGQPCPMCMAAMRIAGVVQVVYAYSNADAAPYGLSTDAIYDDLSKPLEEQLMKIRYEPLRVDGLEDLYPHWHQTQR